MTKYRALIIQGLALTNSVRILRIILGERPIKKATKFNKTEENYNLKLFTYYWWSFVDLCLLLLYNIAYALSKLILGTIHLDSTILNVMTPLHLAIQNNHLEIVNLLIKNGAQIDNDALYGMSPLFLAITKHVFIDGVKTGITKKEREDLVKSMEISKKIIESLITGRHGIKFYKNSLDSVEMEFRGANVNKRGLFNIPPLHLILMSDLSNSIQLKFLDNLNSKKEELYNSVCNQIGKEQAEIISNFLIKKNVITLGDEQLNKLKIDLSNGLQADERNKTTINNLIDKLLEIKEKQERKTEHLKKHQEYTQGLIRSLIDNGVDVNIQGLVGMDAMHFILASKIFDNDEKKLEVLEVLFKGVSKAREITVPVLEAKYTYEQLKKLLSETPLMDGKEARINPNLVNNHLIQGDNNLKKALIYRGLNLGISYFTGGEFLKDLNSRVFSSKFNESNEKNAQQIINNAQPSFVESKLDERSLVTKLREGVLNLLVLAEDIERLKYVFNEKPIEKDYTKKTYFILASIWHTICFAFFKLLLGEINFQSTILNLEAPLHLAVQNNDLKILKLLIKNLPKNKEEREAILEDDKAFGMTPLYLATFNYLFNKTLTSDKKNELKEIIKTLLNEGANPNAKGPIEEIMKLCVKNGVDITRVTQIMNINLNEDLVNAIGKFNEVGVVIQNIGQINGLTTLTPLHLILLDEIITNSMIHIDNRTEKSNNGQLISVFLENSSKTTVRLDDRGPMGLTLLHLSLINRIVSKDNEESKQLMNRLVDRGANQEIKIDIPGVERQMNFKELVDYVSALGLINKNSHSQNNIHYQIATFLSEIQLDSIDFEGFKKCLSNQDNLTILSNFQTKLDSELKRGTINSDEKAKLEKTKLCIDSLLTMVNLYNNGILLLELGKSIKQLTDIESNKGEIFGKILSQLQLIKNPNVNEKIIGFISNIGLTNYSSENIKEFLSNKENLNKIQALLTNLKSSLTDITCSSDEEKSEIENMKSIATCLSTLISGYNIYNDGVSNTAKKGLSYLGGKIAEQVQPINKEVSNGIETIGDIVAGPMSVLETIVNNTLGLTITNTVNAINYIRRPFVDLDQIQENNPITPENSNKRKYSSDSGNESDFESSESEREYGAKEPDAEITLSYWQQLINLKNSFPSFWAK